MLTFYFFTFYVTSLFRSSIVQEDRYTRSFHDFVPFAFTIFNRQPRLRSVVGRIIDFNASDPRKLGIMSMVIELRFLRLAVNPFLTFSTSRSWVTLDLGYSTVKRSPLSVTIVQFLRNSVGIKRTYVSLLFQCPDIDRILISYSISYPEYPTPFLFIFLWVGHCKIYVLPVRYSCIDRGYLCKFVPLSIRLKKWNLCRELFYLILN